MRSSASTHLEEAGVEGEPQGVVYRRSGVHLRQDVQHLLTLLRPLVHLRKVCPFIVIGLNASEGALTFFEIHYLRRLSINKLKKKLRYLLVLDI